MADPAPSGKPSFRPRRYLLDRAAQLRFSLSVVGILAAIGLLYAFAVFVLLDTELLRGRTVAESRVVLLLVHAGYFLVGGAILFVTVVLLTHRFVGPAYVMRQAVARMRRGDFTARLGLRRRDQHKRLAEELRLLRDELAERDAAQVEALEAALGCLETGEAGAARELLERLLAGSASARLRRAREEAA